ncbi:salicylate 1-hydroxylase-like protein [Rhizodiscina lignyota]|uniref:Salicylate 1-hydroxylase-like protein n=1 Tax=Rhizodiscina lignyota TaxID=1504668 RepID=A0A9P4M4G7_9PEZI|nr:salicylate 1-hydroxylase-like protein [Rhizodiscina lignyota]
MASEQKRIRIAVVGGGIGGLCLALGLLRHPQLDVHVYEAAPQFAEIGAGVAFGINAQTALFKLDPRIRPAYETIRTSNVDASTDAEQKKATYFRIQLGMDHKNGKDKADDQICEIMCVGGFSSVHRARFLDSLVALLPEKVMQDNVSFGHRFVDLKELPDGKVQLEFANGKTAEADAVIGCDGIKSEVRQILLGRDRPESKPRFTHKYAYRGLIPMERARAELGDRQAQNSHHNLGYDGHVLTFPIDKGKTMNVVAFQTMERDWDQSDWVKQVKKEDLVRDFQHWGANVRKIIGMMERCDMWALFEHPPSHTYHKKGQICLLGDAAHASTPHQGSGAGMAIEDAYILSSLLGDIQDTSMLEAVFHAYETVRKARTQLLVSRSHEQSMLYDFQADGIRDDVSKLAEILPRRWDWIWDEDLEVELRDARSILNQKAPNASKPNI